MKKSKFLRSSKEMLSRSFNPSKCKTSLRLASSRLKLLRNKKEGQVKQMRREISLLLQSGQDQTARMRVEHVIREEKLVTAFDLIGIYCELIVARLPIIESQKVCPIDLKEAIASVLFASLRCSDVPELAEVKKQFTDKYGKEFVTAAIELRPDCGVNRMLVEKLSAVAADVQTKTKILTAIADEHNVVWNAKSFEDNVIPANDLLKESERHFEPSHDSTLNLTPVSGYSASFQHEEKLHALGGERAQLFRGDSDSIPHNRQRWSMEFKDATSAAQAAAESAEIASMAARAAAELSSRGSITRQHSTESRDSGNHSLRDDARDTYMSSRLRSAHDSTNHGVPVVDRYSPKNSLKEVSRGEKSMQRQEKFENVREEITRKQESSTSAHSHTGISKFSNGKDQDFDYHGGESSFLGSEKKGTHEDSSHKSSVVFDRYDSDTDNYGFDRSPTYGKPQQGFESPLSSQKQLAGSQWKDESRSYKGSPQYDQTQLSLSSDYESEETDGEKHLGKTFDADGEKNLGKTFDADPPPRFNLAKSSPHQPTLVPKQNRTELIDSSPEREEGLNFGKLTGGFRHKGYKYPSLGKNQFDSLSSNEETKATTMLERKNTKPDLQSSSDTDSSEEEDEDSLMMRSDNKHKLYNLTGGKHLSTKPSVAASNSLFGSDSSDLDEDLPKESLRRTSRLLSGISRRTKAFPPNQEKQKYSKSETLDPDEGMDGKASTSTGSGSPQRFETRRNSSKLENYKQHTFISEAATSLRSEVNDSHARMEQKPAKSYSTEPQQHRSFLMGNARLSSSSKATKPPNLYMPGPISQDSAGKAHARIVQEYKPSAKSFPTEEASLPQKKTEPYIKTEMLKKDSSNQKASHVHPKLPDYDSFVQLFQKNRS